jgi:small subunit ribosomal protein S9
VSTPQTVTDADGRPVQTVGRRKEAIVRVRLLPGTGQFKLNGRTIEDYFPNKVHQQLIREPFVLLEKGEPSSRSSRTTGRCSRRPGS